MIRLRRVLRIGAALLALLVAYLAFTFVEVWSAARRDNARPSDAILVLGAAQYNGRPSQVLQARLDHAVLLWKRDLAPFVVVTGGRIEGDPYTEAGVAAMYLHQRGVPDSAILRETQGRSSWESMAASARFLKERGLTRVILVSDPFHSARIDAIAEELGLDAVTSPTRTSPIRGLAALRRMGTETARVAAGQILGYGRLERRGRVGKLVPGLAMLG